jgi:hypothetical protein
MPASHKTNILRLAIILTVLALSVEIAASLLLKNTLPAELAQFVQARETADLTSRQAVSFLSLFLVLAALLAGLIGLWWCKRWARLLFSIAAILIPPTAAIAGFLSGETLVSNAVEIGADSALNIFIGAIFALVWFAMPEEFRRPVTLPIRSTAVASSGMAS